MKIPSSRVIRSNTILKKDRNLPRSLDCCPYCCSEAIAEKWEKLRFWKCASCGLYFRNPMLTEEELSRLYEKAWQRPEERTSETGGTDERLAKAYIANLCSTLELRDFQGLRILDFGAGRGVMSEALANVGAVVTSLEPWGCEYLESRGFQVYRDIHEILRGNREFDGVVMIDVWEHLKDPLNTMHQSNRLLRSKGWCFIATPNPLGLNARIFRNQWREAKKNTHLMFPEPKTMERMFADAGFPQWKKLMWMVRYSNNPYRILLHLGLQLVGLDGELRYLAWKR